MCVYIYIYTHAKYIVQLAHRFLATESSNSANEILDGARLKEARQESRRVFRFGGDREKRMHERERQIKRTIAAL